MDNQENAIDTHCGFVTVLGAPNAGKSTLVNAMVGAKVSIVSSKVQTTRTRVTGILAEDKTQVIFIDTPGIFLAPKRPLEKAMVAAAWREVGDGNHILFIYDAHKRGVSDNDRMILKELQRSNRPAVLVLNKIDLVRRDKLLALTEELQSLYSFSETFMISALKENGVEDLKKHLIDSMPRSVWLYPEDQLSDLPSRLFAAEITREKLFNNLYHELPYSLTVETENWEVFRNGDLKINQVIYLERDSQKSVVLGKGGQKIKLVREQSIADLETQFESKVHLFIHVKVRENWVRDPQRYREIGLSFDF